jgi:hypothetical protein
MTAISDNGNVNPVSHSVSRSAYKWWAESLDHTLNMTNALHTWRTVLKDSTNISSDLLKRCGLWGCLMGGVLASNIAQ